MRSGRRPKLIDAHINFQWQTGRSRFVQDLVRFNTAVLLQLGHCKDVVFGDRRVAPYVAGRQCISPGEIREFKREGLQRRRLRSLSLESQAKHASSDKE